MSRKFFTLFEHQKQPLVSREVFVHRMTRCLSFAFILLVASIFLGAAVYHYAENMSWIEATLNAVMIMTGLGLVDNLHTDGSKIFTCFYAVFAALVFYIVLAIIFAPLIHRFLHEFHLEMTGAKSDD